MIDGSENAIVSWLLNFRIRMFVKSGVNMFCSTNISFISGLSMIVRVNVVLNRTVVIDSDHTHNSWVQTFHSNISFLLFKSPSFFPTGTQFSSTEIYNKILNSKLVYPV